MSPTYERLSAILVKNHKIPPERLTLDAPLEGLGIDSLGTIELLWHIEDAFRIQLPSEPVDLPTLGDVVRYVDALIAQQAPALRPAPASATTLHVAPVSQVT